ncbi:NRAMP-like transporter smf-3 [Extremus antarcticus]|uniref:NRAMP-like transporter smf-3 n=1 Tax=Extremus antarcticus TaxID=702011 RepID=A0AAJ0DP17_9PEZI|nr:NRAMP-like transporter smf-3 [Extremus antarcticus]
MNCPAKTDPIVGDGHNQNPDVLCPELTTRSDLGRIANARKQTGRDHRLSDPETSSDPAVIPQSPSNQPDNLSVADRAGVIAPQEQEKGGSKVAVSGQPERPSRRRPSSWWKGAGTRTIAVLRKYVRFMGPGFMISVAYIDPGNYATDVAAGASYRFKLLFMILLSNIFAIFLQSLCINLGTVTGMDLAQMTRAHCPRWLNYLSYAFGESAIIATDMAEVIGTAMALYMLSEGKIPLVAGCAISIVDVLFILIFYRQHGSGMTAKRVFEFFVALLVLGVVICFCIQLSYISGVTAGEVFHGYVPSSALVQGQGLYQACGILGATVMPHSLYLGSGLVQDRLKDFDRSNNLLTRAQMEASDDDSLKDEPYRPSMQAIQSCRKYSIAECAISLFTFALFVNSAILIVAGASLYDVEGATNASLFGIYDLLSATLAPAAGKLFAVALLLSGTSAGIVCTIAGQMVSEGQLRLTIKPWKRRLLVRSISIVPSIIVAGALGKDGVGKALVGSQVALSIILPFVSAPLVWFTCFGKYMKVTADRIHDLSVQQGVGNGNEVGGEGDASSQASVNMRSHPVIAFIAVLIWIIIVLMNTAVVVLLGLGKT